MRGRLGPATTVRRLFWILVTFARVRPSDPLSNKHNKIRKMCISSYSLAELDLPENGIVEDVSVGTGDTGL
jgi:hypothetical protein